MRASTILEVAIGSVILQGHKLKKCSATFNRGEENLTNLLCSKEVKIQQNSLHVIKFIRFGGNEIFKHMNYLLGSSPMEHIKHHTFLLQTELHRITPGCHQALSTSVLLLQIRHSSLSLLPLISVLALISILQ